MIRNILKSLYRNTKSNYNVSGNVRHLFGNPKLNKPEDFQTLTKDAIQKCLALESKIANELGNDRPRDTIVALDAISNIVCSVIDTAELCRNVHSDKYFRQYANESFLELASFINDLNSNEILYKRLVELTSCKIALSKLTSEEVYVANDMLTEMIVNGIHLKDDNKINAKILQDEIAALESEYMNNISNTSNTLFTVTNIPLHTFTYIKTFQHPQITINNENNSMTFPASLSSSLYLSIDDSLVRSMMWMQLRSYPQSNIEALCQLIEKRQQLANILGFQSYAHKELSRKVIREPESIMKLLNDASQGIHDVAVNEYTKLHQIKQQSNDTSDIKPWDLSRLMYLYNSTIDNNNVASEYDNMKELQEHLPLYACVESLQLITSSLFGIDTIIETVPDNEKWADDVLKVTLYNSNETNKEFMGTIYLDLLQRNNKFPGSGHFTLSLACDAHDPNLKPIVVLVLNFAESCKPLRPLEPVQYPPSPWETLSLHNLETLYHEWGHALHSILSRTSLQHLAGTRGSTDFMEVPSILFENFAKNKDVLLKWIRHPVTNKIIDENILINALSSKNNFQAMELQGQLLISAVDQYVFGDKMNTWLNEKPRSTEEIFQHLNNTAAEFQDNFSLTHAPVFDSNKYSSINLLSHPHFINYGGAYHSYLFAKIHATQIWKTLFSTNPLSRASGLLLWKELLRYGASRDPNVTLEVLGNGKTDPRHLLT